MNFCQFVPNGNVVDCTAGAEAACLLILETVIVGIKFFKSDGPCPCSLGDSIYHCKQVQRADNTRLKVVPFSKNIC